MLKADRLHLPRCGGNNVTTDFTLIFSLDLPCAEVSWE